MQKEIECAHCHRTGLRRIERVGFLQTRIYPRFGLYPWECPFCRKITLLKVRGRKKRLKQEDTQFDGPAA